MVERDFETRLARLLKGTIEEFYLIELGEEPTMTMERSLHDDGWKISSTFVKEGQMLNSRVFVRVIGDDR